MILGLFFRKVGILDESFTSKMNKFVFKIALPVLLFQDLCENIFSDPDEEYGLSKTAYYFMGGIMRHIKG